MSRRVVGSAAPALVSAALLAAGPYAGMAQARPYEPTGTPIDGAQISGSASLLEPGVYVDTLATGAEDVGSDGSAKYYAIDLASGDRPFVAATLAGPADLPDRATLTVSVSMTAFGADATCGDDSASDDSYDDRLGAVTAVAAPGVTGTQDACPAGKVLVKITRGGDAAAADPLDVEIAFRLEPPADASGLPGPATEGQNLQTDLAGRPAALESANSYASAPVLGSGVYSDTLEAGDTRIVRVHLEWGQRFAYSFTSAEQPDISSDESVTVTATIRNPMREDVDQPSGANESTSSLGQEDGELDGSTLVPVRYENRRSDDEDVARYSIAGDYFLVLGTSVPASGDDSRTFDYALKVQVFGSAGRGPIYAAPGHPPGGPGTASASGTGAASGSEDSTTFVIAWALGAAAVVVVALVVLVIGRRRRASRAHAP